MGTTLREIIYDIGGGIPRGQRSSRPPRPADPPAAASRQPTSTCRSTTTRCTKIGSIMGSGGMIVMDEDTCMVDVAKFFLNFPVDESCGKCAPCRVGVNQMCDILSRITEGRGRESDIEPLDELAAT